MRSLTEIEVLEELTRRHGPQAGRDALASLEREYAGEPADPRALRPYGMRDHGTLERAGDAGSNPACGYRPQSSSGRTPASFSSPEVEEPCSASA